MATKRNQPPKRPERPTRRRKPTESRPSRNADVQVQYTPAKPFNRKRFLLYLATVAAVVLALVLGMSIFFKVGKVNVSGTVKYTPWEIREASGIQDGDALLNLNEAKIVARIREKLHYVGDVRVGIKLPDTVNIEVIELQVVYAVEDTRSYWWLIDAAGKIVDTTDAAQAKAYTRILGLKIQPPELGQQAVAVDPKPEALPPVEDDVPVVTQPVIPGSQLMDAAVQVMSALEANGVMGTIDTVDVSDPENLMMQYEDRYKVFLGDVSRLPDKIALMKAMILGEEIPKTGNLDVSFKIWPDQGAHTPFESDNDTKK